MVITVSHAGYIKRVGTDTYRAQGRGGRGITGATVKEEDFVEHLFIGWAHSYVLVFTDLGRIHWLRVYEIPEAGRTSKGRPLINLIQLQPGEKVKAFVPIKSFDDPDSFLVFATANGTINKMSLEDFSRPRANGVNAINLLEGDNLIRVALATNEQDVMIGSRNGQAIRFSMSKFRQMGRGTKGVRGINLAENDRVIGMVVIREDLTILTVTEKGYGKRTKPAEYRLTGRGGKGVRNIKVTEKNGLAVAIAAVSDDQELMVLTKAGIIIKMNMDAISTLGRDTQGVRVIRLKGNDMVADVEILDKEEVIEESSEETTENTPSSTEASAEVTTESDEKPSENEGEKKEGE